MADPDELQLVYRAFALAIGPANRYVTGYVEWCDDRAANQVRRVLGHLGNLTPEGVRIDAIKFVRQGGLIEQVRETRPEWSFYEYYYKIILPYPFVPRGVFVEKRLIDDEQDDPVVHLVNTHRQGV